jgi:hypothetical protein
MTDKQRAWTIFFTALGLLALLVLAASLSNLQLQPGERISFEEIAPDFSQSGESGGMFEWLMSVFRVLMIFAWVFLPLYIIYLFKSKEARRRLLRDLAIFLPIILLLYILSSNMEPREREEEASPEFGGQPAEVGEAEVGAPMPEFTEPPPWVTTVTSLVLAAGITLSAVGVVYFVWRRNPRQPMEPLLAMEREAQAAIDAIEAGGDLREVIIRCYYQMIDALNEYRNIQRGRDMTPHEFELYLERRGMPRGPVHDLTQLFEQVRYGARKPGLEEERTAITSLTAIINACKRTRTT